LFESCQRIFDILKPIQPVRFFANGMALEFTAMLLNKLSQREQF
jgi:hypothetical protein